MIWSERALENLEIALAFIAADSPEMAQIVARQIIEATDRLQEFPRSGRITPELGLESSRELIVYSYRILYRIEGEEVHITAVHHGARLFDLKGEE